MQIIVIETFLKIAEVGTFSRASELLCVAQPTVTARIQTLENSLGKKVFHRQSNTVELTPAGREFLPHARTLVIAWHTAKQSLSTPKRFHGTLTVGAPPALWCNFLLEKFDSLRHTNTALAFNGVIADPKSLVDRLESGELDAFVAHQPSMKKSWTARKLFSDELVLVSTAPQEPTLHDPRYMYIDWGDGYQEQHYRAYPHEAASMAAFSDGQIALQALLTTGGSAYLPRRWVERDEYAERLFPVAGAQSIVRDVVAVFDQSMAEDLWRGRAIDQLFS